MKTISICKNKHCGSNIIDRPSGKDVKY